FRRQLEIALRDREADYNKDGYISGSELGQYIQNTVTDAAPSPQDGKICDRDLNKGDFVFAVGLARQEVKIVPPDMGDWDIGSVSIASGSLTINTTTEGHLSITINNTSRDIAYLPDYSTLPIPKISAGNLEVRMVYADGYTENKTVTVEPDKTAEVNFNYRPVPVPDPNLNPDPPGRPPQLGRGPYYSTGKKIGTGFLNLALGLGSFTMGDLGGGLIVAGGYTASAAMIVTEILLMEDGVVGTIGLGVAGAAALFGFIRPFMYDRQLVKQNSAPQFMSRVNAGITPDGRGNATLTFSYTHRF
ncbi:MAG: hypothetical protein LBQ38_06415, partial [Spirochaetaceae bacterium]|nr:hypothetical protein [Spirochaetaceae bacterium]